MKPTKLLLALAALCGLAVQAHASIIVNDTWQDLERTNPAAPVYSEFGVDSDSDTDIESRWFSSTGVTGLTNPVPGTLRGIVGASSSSWTTYFTAEGSEITLSNPGDWIKVTWVFTPTGVNAASSAQQFNLAIVDSPAATRITTDTTPGNNEYPGYGMWMNMNTTLNNANPFQLRERSAVVTSFLANANGWTALTNSEVTATTGYADGTQYTFVFSATFTDSGLAITNSMTGGSLGGDGQLNVDYVDVTPRTLTFDTFHVRPSSSAGAAAQFDTSLFKVEFNQVCVAASVVNDPTNTSVATGQTATFFVTPGGAAPTKQWQVSTDNGTNWNNVTTGSGGTTTAYTTPATTLADSGNKYRGIINVACDSSSFTSAVATLTVFTPRNLSWVGGGANLWDTSTANWTGDATVFGTNDAVRFTDSGNNAVPIDLVGTIMPSSILVSNVTKNYTIGSTTSGLLGGQFSLTKLGAGKLTLTTSNSFSDKTTVSGGTLSIDNEAELGALPGLATADQLTLDGGTLEVTVGTRISLNRGVTLGASGGTFDIPAGINFTNNPSISGAGGLTKASTGGLILTALSSFAGNMTIDGGLVTGITAQNGGGNSLFGAINTNRTITVNNGAILSFDRGNIFAGGNTTVVTPAPQIIVNQGSTLRTRINDGNNFGKITLNGATFDLGIGFSADFGAAILTDTITVGGSAASTIIKDAFSLFTAANLGYRTSTNGITFDVADATGNADADLVVSAPLWNAAPATTNIPPTTPSLVKTGPGTLELNDANIYTGQTIVSNGTLAGIGSIAGPVLVEAGGKIGGGSDAGVGALTINNNLTLNGGVYVRVNNSGGNDPVSVSGTLINNGTGTVTVNNIGPALAVGNSFTIFNQPVVNGNAMSVSGGSVTWTNRLAVDGSIVVVSLVSLPDYSTNLSFSVSGNTLTVSWPGTHLGWILQSQTNSLSVGITTPANTWSDVLGSDAVTQQVVTINPANPTVFYRLRHP